ncbi:MAG: BatD family protein, partial [Candidatus Neomarinimicrobiota bacterium]
MKILVGNLFFLNIIFSQTVNVSVDKQSLQKGDVLQLSIEVSGAKNFPKIEMDKLNNNFDIVGGPYEKTTIEFINGKMKDTKTLTWNLSARKTGNLSIPAIQGSIDGKEFVSKPIKILVANTLKDVSEKSVFILAEVDKKSAYLGEQITLTYKLYKDINTKIAGIDQFQMPDFNGFWVEEIFTPQRLQYQNKTVLFQGRKYQVANLGQRALF